MTQETSALRFVVSDFPTFGESTQTRAIGTQDEGKTAWENGDQIIVTLTSQKYGEQAAALTYDGSSWSTEASLSYLENETPIVSVFYAPCYEVTEEGTMQFRSGMQPGMTEYLYGNYQIENGIMTITFEGAIRTYSRLRIAGLANQTLTVTTTNFTPGGATEVATAAYTLTADKNGNAFLYGIFAEGATVSVKQGDVILKDYTFTAEKNPNGTEHNKSYALDARPVIDGTLGGKTEATKDDLAAMVELLKSYIENGHTTIIVTGSQPAKLLMSGYLTPIVSLAFEQLTYVYQDEKNDSYWGTVDLIYQDVTEIVEYEFYCCDVLKSITLPKVTTVGDRGFWACFYLETLTFGSVVTTIYDNSGEVFYNLGYKIDGCNLVLNCGQMHTEDTYKPDLENNVWFKSSWGGDVTWKNITLTHGKAIPGSYENIGPEGHTCICSVCYATVTEAHSGEATCTHPAECEHCWAEFGDIDPDNHNYHGSICIDCGHFDADAAEVEIYDGYYSRVIIDDDYDVEKLTYYRELPNQEWNSLYVPFEIEVTDELLEDYEVAYMNNMHTYDADDDGSIDQMEMEIIKIKYGTLKANYPYFIRAKNTEAMDMNLVVENALVESTVGRTVSCQSVRSIFELRGIYERMSQSDFAEMYGTHYAISTEGGWWQTEGLNPFRAYLTIIPRSGTPVNAPAMRRISFRVKGEGETTGIENSELKIENSDVIYDLMGRRVLEPQKGGIYIVDGKKVVIK